MLLESYFIPDRMVFEQIEQMVWKNKEFVKENEAYSSLYNVNLAANPLKNQINDVFRSSD